jgi:hypothetical protein
MKDDIQYEFGLTLPVTSAKSRNRELLFEQSERPPHVMPTELMIALLAVSQLESVPPANVNEVLADICQPGLGGCGASERRSYDLFHQTLAATGDGARASRCL